MSNTVPPRTTDPYLQVVRTEVAMEVINRARGLVHARVCQLEDGTETDQREAERLTVKAGELYRLLRSLDFREQDRVEEVIARWGSLVSDEARFWPALEGGHLLHPA
jgi:hypothetical protein